jgi:hypothetical protein
MAELIAAGEAAVADALQQAAACASLQLNAFSACARHSCSSIAAALCCLPSSSLTSLSLAFYPTEEQQLDQLRAALAALTNLRQLQLKLPTHSSSISALQEPPHLDLAEQLPIFPQLASTCSDGSSSMSTDAEPSSQAMCGLQQLVALQMTGVINFNDLASLPCSLQQLQLSYSCRSREAAQVPASEGDRPPLQLQQLRQLTSLQLSSCCPSSSGELVLEAEDELPPNLVQLSVRGPISSVRPILQAKQLQQLNLQEVQLDAAQLMQLGACSLERPSAAVNSSDDSCASGRLSLLTRLQLSYDSRYQLNESAAGWGMLGNRLLDLRVDLARSDPACISQHVLQHLSACRGLTRLELHNVGHIEATAEQLGSVLQQLAGLRRLVLGQGWQWALRGIVCDKVSCRISCYLLSSVTC